MVSPPLELGTLGMSDTLILMVMALVVFGPRRLPQIGRQIGKLMYEFRKASNDFKFQMEEEMRLSEEADRRKKEEAERARNLALNPPAETVQSQAAIGAQESVSAPAHPLYGSGSGYPEAYPPETPAAAADEPAAPIPRIQPPSTGTPVPAKQGSVTVEQGTEEGTINQADEEPRAVSAEESIGAEPSAESTEPPAGAHSASQQDSSRSETVSQHG